MKRLIIFTLLMILSSQSFAQYKTEKNVPDILVQTKMDTAWSEFFIRKIRTFFVNNDLPDFFYHNFQEPITSTLKPFETNSDPLVTTILQSVQKLFNIQLKDAQLVISINGLDYKMEKLSAKMKPTSKAGDLLAADTVFGIGELTVVSPQLHFEIKTPDEKGVYKTFFSFDVNDIEIKSAGNEKLEFLSHLSFKRNDTNDYKFTFDTGDFSAFEEKIKNNPEMLIINPKVNFSFPEVKVKVADRVATFPASKINKWLYEQLPEVKKFAVKQLINAIKTGQMHKLVKLLETLQFDREYWTDLSLMSMFSFDHLTNNSSGDVIIEMSSDYCTKTEFEFEGVDCYKRNYAHDVVRAENKERLPKSVEIMDQLLKKGQGNIVISASEEYLTRILKKTFDAGFWDSSFKDLPVALGPKKMVVFFNEKGNDGNLYLDLLYNTSKLERAATGLKQVNFPMQLKINAKVESIDSVPHLVVNISDVNMNDDFFLYGDSTSGFTSNIHKGRFKKMVLKTIKKILKKEKLVGENILVIALPEIRNLALEKAHLFSDGNGRMIGLMKLEDNILEGVKLKLDQSKSFIPY